MKNRFKTVLDNVKTTFSALAAVQSAMNVITTADALPRIHLFACDETGDANPPRIILDVDGANLRWAGGQFMGPIYVLVLLEFSVPAASCETEWAQAAWFWEQVEDIIDDFEDAVNGGGQLAVNVIDMVLPPGPIEPDEIAETQTNRAVWITQLRLELES